VSRLVCERLGTEASCERHVLAALVDIGGGLGELLDPGPLIQLANAVTRGSLAPPHVHDHRRSDGTSTQFYR
jgi:hypothetical protein